MPVGTRQRNRPWRHCEASPLRQGRKSRNFVNNPTLPCTANKPRRSKLYHFKLGSNQSSAATNKQVSFGERALISIVILPASSIVFKGMLVFFSIILKMTTLSGSTVIG